MIHVGRTFSDLRVADTRKYDRSSGRFFTHIPFAHRYPAGLYTRSCIFADACKIDATDGMWMGRLVVQAFRELYFMRGRSVEDGYPISPFKKTNTFIEKTLQHL